MEPPKSNWAIPLETAPFFAFPVTCGITFTFGGLHADTDGRVLDTDGAPIPGLFVCGEMLGGLFSGNYPGGTGLTSGAVFGRRRRVAGLTPVGHETSDRMSSAFRVAPKVSPSFMTPANSAALRVASASTFSSIVSRAISR